MTLEKIAKASGRLKRQSGKDYLFAIPCKLLSYVVAHTFAIKFIYPGSVSIISWALGKTLLVFLLFIYIYIHTHKYIFILFKVFYYVKGSTLLKGRIDLIKQGGERFKLMTIDKNQIDAMFIDRRNK